MFFFIQTMDPEGAELIKHIPAFLGHRFTNERKSKYPLFSGTGLPMKENIKIPEEQLPKMAGAEKRILKKALRAETIVSLPPLASSDDI